MGNRIQKREFTGQAEEKQLLCLIKKKLRRNLWVQNPIFKKLTLFPGYSRETKSVINLIPRTEKMQDLFQVRCLNMNMIQILHHLKMSLALIFTLLQIAPIYIKRNEVVTQQSRGSYTHYLPLISCNFQSFQSPLSSMHLFTIWLISQTWNSLLHRDSSSPLSIF